MKKLLLLLLSFVSITIYSQGTCATALDITANGVFVTGAIDGTYPTGTGLCFASGSASPNAKWYKFTPTANGVMSVTSAIAANPGGTSATATDSRLGIYTGTCAALTCVAVNDDVSDTDYRSAVSNFVVTSGTTYYIVWDDRWQNTSFSFEFTFVAQSCFVPTGFTFTVAPTTTTAGIGWTAPASGSTPTGYEFEYGLQGFTQGTGTTLTPTTNSVSLTSLTPSSVYSFYIRTNCGAGTFSVWSGPISFNTVFTAVAPPYNTGFEQTELDYIGWFAPTTTAGNDFYPNNGGAGSALVQEGSYALAGVSSATATSDAFAISRGVTLEGGQPVTVTLYASNFRATGNTTSTASYNVTYGTAQTAAAQTNIVASETGLSAAAFTLKTYNFTPATTGTYYIGIRNLSPANTGGATHALLIDNFSVTQVLSNNTFVESKIGVYPNPVNDAFVIENNESLTITSLTISDINGRTVKNINVNSIGNEINISELNSGIYFLNIATDNGTATKKIIKN